jgi:hypothetical protein
LFSSYNCRLVICYGKIKGPSARVFAINRCWSQWNLSLLLFFFFAKTISLLFGSTCLCQVTFSKVRFVKHINGPDPHVCIRIIFDFLFPKLPVDMGGILRRLKSNDQLCKMTPHYRWPVKPFFCDIQFVSCTKSVLFFECSCCIFQLKY